MWGHLGRGKWCRGLASLRPLLFRGATPFEFHMFSRPTTIDKTGIQRPVAARNQALATPGSFAPQNLAAGPEQNPLCRIVDIGREGEGRFLFGEQAAR